MSPLMKKTFFFIVLLFLIAFCFFTYEELFSLDTSNFVIQITPTIPPNFTPVNLTNQPDETQNVSNTPYADFSNLTTLPPYTFNLAVATSKLNIRESNTTNSKSLGLIPKNAVVIVHSSNEEWWYVTYGTITGYSFSEYLVPINSDYANTETPLVTFSTLFSVKKNDYGRVFNIIKAASLIDGSIIPPGTTFSTLSRIGPITQKGGYEQAPEYKVTNGVAEVVTGYGGGVCQVSTTLYNTVILAQDFVNLRVVERHEHALPVSYVSEGMDATISYSSGKDFRFINKSDHTIVVRTYVLDGTISVYFAIKGT